ncbi:MAG: hypothetical protein JWM44_641 [Bacilli bacterium]|nr:hypothetical protein [Bacilli bacterium]
MKEEQIRTDSLRSERWTYKGKPLRILSTSLGLALVANLFLGASAFAEATPTPTPNVADQPKLVEWSSDQVKKYYDPSVDWNIPMPADTKQGNGDSQANSGSNNSSTSGNSNSTVIVNNGGGYYGGGFGWTDLLLYHMIFNRGGFYSSNHYYNSNTVFNAGTSQPYKAKSFSTDTFQNRPTTGSTVRPNTSQKSGTFSTKSNSSTKSTTSSKGGIGGNSSGLSSSSKSSGGSFGS